MPQETLENPDVDAIDTAWSTPTYEIQSSVSSRLGGTLAKRKHARPGVSAAEMLEIRQMPSGTSIDAAKATIADLESQIVQVDAEIAAVPSAANLNWKASSVAGWNGELPSSAGKLMYHFALTASGNTLVECYKDGSIELRDAATGDIRKTLNTGIGRAYSIEADPITETVYVSAGSGTGGALIAIDATTGSELWRAKTGDNTNQGSVSPDGTRMIVDVDYKGSLIFDAKTGQRLGSTNEVDYGGSSLSGNRIANMRGGNEVWLFGSDGSSKKIFSLGGVSKIDELPGQNKIIAGGANGALCLYNLATGQETRFSGENSQIVELACVNATTVAVSHVTGTVEFFDVSGTPKIVKTVASGGQFGDHLQMMKGNLIVQTREGTPMLRTMTMTDSASDQTKAALTLKKATLQANLVTAKADLAAAEAQAAADAKAAADAAAALLEAAKAAEAAKIANVTGVTDQTLTQMANAIMGPLQFSENVIQEDPNELVCAPVSMIMRPMGDGSQRSEVVLNTPFDHSVFVSRFGTRTFDHVGGAEGLVVLCRIMNEQMDWSKSNPTDVAILYADDAKTIKVAEIVFVGDRANGSVSIASMNALPILRSQLPSHTEAMKAPLLKPVAIEGSNITLAVSSPACGTSTVKFIGLHDDGIFTSFPVEQSTDGSVSPVTLGMNASNPTGDYDIVLRGEDLKGLSRIRVHWDFDCKKLSLCEGTCLYQPTECVGKALNAQMQEVLALAKDPTVGSGVLSSMQQESLIDGVHALSSGCEICPEFETKFWAAHPEWRDDRIHDTAMKAYATQTGTFTPTQIYDSLMKQRSEEMAVSRDAYGKFHGMLGDLMQQGLSVLSQIRAGGNEPELKRNFALAVDRAATSLPMAQLSGCGITMPNADTLLQAVKLVWSSKCSEIVETKAAESRVSAGLAYEEQRIASGNYVRTAEGSVVAKNDPNEALTQYYVDANGRLTILAQESTGITHVNNSNLVASSGMYDTMLSPAEQIALRQKTITDLGIIAGATLPDLKAQLTPGGTHMFTFTLAEDSMVNASSLGNAGVTQGPWSMSNPMANFSLQLSGGPNRINYISSHSTGSGESISAMLPKGNYTLTIADATSYPSIANLSAAQKQTIALPLAHLGLEAHKYNTAKIEGKVSIEGNSQVMPVGMSVAAFDKLGTRVSVNPITGEALKLDPSKPVWVVIHGMNSSEKDSTMSELAKALHGYAESNNLQVVTLDWKDAAEDGILTQDAAWVTSVGQWLGRQLVAAGFDPEKIDFSVWSHGTFVAVEAAKEIERMKGSQINTIVALDAPRNFQVINGYDQTKVNLAAASRNSIEFDSSIIAGDDILASTADVSFKIRSSSIDPFVRHKIAVTAFTEILNHEKGQQSDFSSYLSLQRIMQSSETNKALYGNNAYAGCFEGIIDVTIQEIAKNDGTYYRAIPSVMTIKKPDTLTEEKVSF